MKDQFVTYEIAKKLKELGFDEPCFSKWEKYINTFKLYPILATFGLNTPYEKESNGYDQKQVNEGGYTFTGYKNNVLDHGKDVITAPLWQQAIEFINKTNIFVQELENNHWSVKDKTVSNYQVISGTKEGAILRALELI